MNRKAVIRLCWEILKLKDNNWKMVFQDLFHLLSNSRLFQFGDNTEGKIFALFVPIPP